MTLKISISVEILSVVAHNKYKIIFE